MLIRVRRTGGFAGIERSAEVDTAGRADAAELHDLAEAVAAGKGGDGSEGGAGGQGVPDGFSYEITIDGDRGGNGGGNGGRTVRFRDPHLTDAQRALVRKVLAEGA
ncbi:protealysin inhibitor emfourin [Streptomyces sp. NPDC046203]|uniref:protealysin inhibitor emfourin n=1 Tax=Streptomyces sp. NPDC046203 TaxID=3154602 RepID=UPI0033EC223B